MAQAAMETKTESFFRGRKKSVIRTAAIKGGKRTIQFMR
jgi:hypothetical protein